MPKHARVLLSPEQRGALSALIAAGSAPTQILTELELHYTPKHGSWLDIAEIELSALAGQCLDRRIPDTATLETEVAAWVADRNAAQVTVSWRFTTEDARIKRHHLYPTLQS